MVCKPADWDANGNFGGYLQNSYNYLDKLRNLNYVMELTDGDLVVEDNEKSNKKLLTCIKKPSNYRSPSRYSIKTMSPSKFINLSHDISLLASSIEDKNNFVLKPITKSDTIDKKLTKGNSFIAFSKHFINCINLLQTKPYILNVIAFKIFKERSYVFKDALKIEADVITLKTRYLELYKEKEILKADPFYKKIYLEINKLDQIKVSKFTLEKIFKILKLNKKEIDMFYDIKNRIKLFSKKTKIVLCKIDE